ncbi:BrnA antitoxin family protein [Rhodovastum atsumiense]|uniref:BrnA antitoxin family protein n=2 Tax=Rhodovastum atsumiense TaxID=504468 RepID=A0A5M6IRZ1_9PROT|nr:BrnA antitoxin family protein [Rhodovastum atsumiense]
MCALRISMRCIVYTDALRRNRKLYIHMPRGDPKKAVSIRLDPKLIEAVRATGEELTTAVESGLRLWLKRITKKPSIRKPTPD